MNVKRAETMHLDHWPNGQPFPLTDAECAALCRGHAVRWGGTIEELVALPGRHELLNGWLILRR